MSFHKERTKLQSNIYNTYVKILIQNIWFRVKYTESTKRQKTSIVKEIVKIANPHKPVLNKTMTTQE